MPRQEYSIHYIYKITCRLNGNYYIGMHSTFNLEDGYMGSGKRIKRSIEKHGLENHTKEILEYLPNRSSLKEREKEIVNEELLNDSQCMNLKIGGEGGLSSKEHKEKWIFIGGIAGRKKIKELRNNKEWLENIKYKMKLKWENKDYREMCLKNWKFNKLHSDETKKKMSDKAKLRIGSKNSQFGTCWITNDKENKKILKEGKIPNGWKLGRKIK